MDVVGELDLCHRRVTLSSETDAKPYDTLRVNEGGGIRCTAELGTYETQGGMPGFVQLGSRRGY